MPLDIPASTRPETPRTPGDFARTHRGAPRVTDPTATTKHKGNKPELLALAKQRGLYDGDAKDITVAELHELLGEQPKMVTYSRPSSYGKIIENAETLTLWERRAAVLGCFRDPISVLAPLVGVENLELSEDHRDLLNDVAAHAKQVARADLAADRGTHTHVTTEVDDDGQDIITLLADGVDLGIPVDVQLAVLESWRQLVEGRFELLASEIAVVSDVYRSAGTLDRIARLLVDFDYVTADGEKRTIRAGTVVVLDIKTGQLRVKAGQPEYWHSYAVQVAIYAGAVPYNVDSDLREQWPEGVTIDQNVALIAHLDVKGALDTGVAVARLIAVDLAAGRHGADLAQAAKEWEKRHDLFSVVDATPPVATVDVDSVESTSSVAPSTPSHRPDVEQRVTTAPDSLPPAGPVVTDPQHVQRCEELRTRLRQLDNADQQSVAAEWDTEAWGPISVLRTPGDVTAETLAGIETLLERHDPFTATSIPPKVKPVPEPMPVLNDTPDEGDTDVRDDTVAVLRRRAAELPGSARSWVSWVLGGCRPMLDLDQPSMRRVELLDGLLLLAANDMDDNDTLRGLLAAVIGDIAHHQTLSPGRVLGSLDVDQAHQFSDLCDAAVHGYASLRIDDQGRSVWSLSS